MKIDKIKEEISIVKKEAKNKTAGYIVTALGLVTGLAWNDAVKSIIETFFPAKEQTIWAKLIYASILTIIVVVLSVYVVKIFNSVEKKEKNKK